MICMIESAAESKLPFTATVQEKFGIDIPNGYRAVKNWNNISSSSNNTAKRSSKDYEHVWTLSGKIGLIGLWYQMSIYSTYFDTE